MIVGAHVPSAQPLEEARAVDADCIQMFVGPPQSWKQPPVREDAGELRASPTPIFVHAPYLINVASPNNRVRIPSRKILTQTLERAEQVGAAGVIVHAGHAEDAVERGLGRWRKVFEELDSPVRVLIENTAGGTNAMGRSVDTLARLFEALDGFEVGFCFDTCHAHAAGEELESVVPRLLATVGHIDLVHANSSRDPFGCGRDRHANFGEGTLDPESLLGMVRASGAPAVICETPWSKIDQDIAWLRERL